MRPHFDREELPSIGVDEEFSQDTHRVNKGGVLELPSGKNASRC